MKPDSTSSPVRARLVLIALISVLPVALGCSGLFQNLGAKWVARQIGAEFNFDEAQNAATRASVERLIAAAPAALSSKVDMLVATADTALSKGVTEQKLRGMERQVDKVLDVVAGTIIDEISPIFATLRDDQIDFAEARINERLDEAREELQEPKEDRLEKRADSFVGAVEDWAGDISSQQERSLRQFIAKLPDEGASRLVADRGGSSECPRSCENTRVPKRYARGSGANGRAGKTGVPTPDRAQNAEPRDEKRSSSSTGCSRPSRRHTRASTYTSCTTS